jgi:antitoxin (DNA-binding transcriptional repressor) of toxin-antitoxin stability system
LLDLPSPRWYDCFREHWLPQDTKISATITFRELQQRLPELLDRVAQNGEECVVQRDGKALAVIVNPRRWRRRRLSARLDAACLAGRVPESRQKRGEALLALQSRRSLTPAERRELKSILRECDAVMLRRAATLEHLASAGCRGPSDSA